MRVNPMTPVAIVKDINAQVVQHIACGLQRCVQASDAAVLDSWYCPTHRVWFVMERVTL